MADKKPSLVVPPQWVEAMNAETTELMKVLFSHMEDQIRFADSKAQGLLLLATSALVAVAITGALNKGTGITLIDSGENLFSRFSALLIILMFVALIVSIYCAVLTLRPWPSVPGIETLLYFDSISRLSLEEFIRKFTSQTHNDLNVSMLSAIHTKAQIADWKFFQVRLGLNFLLVAMVLWGAAQIMSAFAR